MSHKFPLSVPINPDYIKFDNTPTGVDTFEEGKIFYDDEHTAITVMLSGEVRQQIGFEDLVKVFNSGVTPIPNGSLVYISDSNISGIPTVSLANVSTKLTASVLGMTTQAISASGYGFVTTRGIVHDLNTSAFNKNDILYLSESTPGTISTTPPTGVNNFSVIVGMILSSNVSAGSIYVRLIFNNRLVDLTDTDITNPLVDQVLKYNGTEWINGPQSTVNAGAGIAFFISDTPVISGGTQSVALNTLSKTPVSGAESIESIACNNTTVVIDRYLYDNPLNGTQIDSGIWIFNTYGYVDGATGISSMPVTVRKVVAGTGILSISGSGNSRIATVSGGTPFLASFVDADMTLSSLLRTPTAIFRITGYTSSTIVTVETLSTYSNETNIAYSTHQFLFVDSTTEINNTSVGLISSQTAQPAFPINATDKLAITYYARTDTNRTLYLYHGGNTNYTHFTSPLVVRHNDIAGLQGGNAGERYHLTSQEATNVANLSNTYAPLAHSTNHLPSGSDPITTNFWHGVVSRSTVLPLPSILESNTFTLLTGATPLQYYYKGTLINVNTNRSVVLPLVSGKYFIYFTDGTGVLTYNTAFPDQFNNVLVAAVLWDNVIGYGLVSDERHNHTRDIDWHITTHQGIGTRYISGLDFSYTGTTNANTTFAISAGQINNEDIKFAITPQTTVRLFYQISANTYDFDQTPSTLPYWYDGGIIAMRSDTYMPETVSLPNRYFNYFVFASTDVNIPVYIIVETVAPADITGYTSVALARAAAVPNLNNSNLSGELKFLYRIVVNGDGLIQTPIAADDYRTGGSLPGGGTPSTSHGGLSNLDIAEAGVTYGHINDQTQTIAGNKIFSGSVTALNIDTRGPGNIVTNVSIGTNALSSNVTGGNNIAIGNDALKNNTDSYNIAIGPDAGKSLALNSNHNVAIGAGILMAAVSATNNIGIGENCLSVLNSGTQNTVIGINALPSAATANDNAILGANALEYIVTGSYNIALGSSAGKLILAGTNNTQSANSIYIGYDTRSLSGSNTNEIVIGHQAVGNGSNSITLGNASIEKTIIKGNLLIGTVTDIGARISGIASLIASTGNEIAYSLAYTTNKAAGDDTGLLIAMTDTTSPGTSKTLDIKVNNVSVFSIDASGNTLINSGTNVKTALDSKIENGGSVAKITSAVSAPNSPSNGDLWIDTASTGSSWSKKMILGFSPATAELTGGLDEPELIGVASAVSGNPHWSELRYSDSVDEEAIWMIPSVVTKDYLGGNITAKINWLSAVTTGTVIWQIRLLGRTTGEAVDTAFDVTSHSVSGLINNTASGSIITTTLTFLPAVAELTANDSWWIALRRVGTGSEDTAVGDAKLIDFGIFEV